MRFVAGRGAVAERLQRGGAVAERLAAAWRIAIGKKLLPGRAIGKKLLAGTPWQSCWPRVPWRRGWRHCGRELSGIYCWPGRRHNLARPPLLHLREEIGKNLKSTRKPHSELLVEEGEEDSILFCNFGGKM